MITTTSSISAAVALLLLFSTTALTAEIAVQLPSPDDHCDGYLDLDFDVTIVPGVSSHGPFSFQEDSTVIVELKEAQQCSSLMASGEVTISVAATSDVAVFVPLTGANESCATDSPVGVYQVHSGLNHGFVQIPFDDVLASNPDYVYLFVQAGDITGEFELKFECTTQSCTDCEVCSAASGEMEISVGDDTNRTFECHGDDLKQSLSVDVQLGCTSYGSVVVETAEKTEYVLELNGAEICQDIVITQTASFGGVQLLTVNPLMKLYPFVGSDETRCADDVELRGSNSLSHTMAIDFSTSLKGVSYESEPEIALVGDIDLTGQDVDSLTLALRFNIQCTPRPQCPADLVDPTDGTVGQYGTDVGSTAIYSCVSDFTLVGDRVLTCLDNGEWSSSAPTCVDYSGIQCPADLVNPDNGTVGEYGTDVGSTAIYTCDSDFNLEGDKVRTCQGTGEWSGEAPTCVHDDDSSAPERTSATLVISALCVGTFFNLML